MKILVTGASGQLGYDMIKLLKSENIDYLATDRDSLQITDKEQVFKVIKNYNPDVIIHCAAYTAVDRAEDEKELCHSVNTLGTSYIAQVCNEINAKMIYISTDYVFDGQGIKPFEVTDTPNPINFYGKTKYEGELEVQKKLKKYFIVRISWVFGFSGKNFVNTILRLGKEKKEISVVSDQIGSPTYTSDLSKLMFNIAKSDNYCVCHASNEGFCSWYEFACEILNQAGLDVKVNPIKTINYPTKAKRPLNSRMNKIKTSETFNFKFRSYIEAVNDYLKEVL